MVEHPAVNRRVASSSLACGALRLVPSTKDGTIFFGRDSLRAPPSAIGGVERLIF